MLINIYTCTSVSHQMHLGFPDATPRHRQFQWVIITHYHPHFPLTWWVTHFDFVSATYSHALFIVSNTSKIYSSSTTDGSDGPDFLLVAPSQCGQCATRGGTPLILPLISTTKGPCPLKFTPANTILTKESCSV